jgi:hypothetical protein
MSEAEVLAEVRRILDQRWPAEKTIRAVRRLMNPPREHRVIERTERGWPILRASDAPRAAWERDKDLDLSQ